MTDFVIFSSESFMNRTKVCVDSVKEFIPDANIHLVELPNNKTKPGTYIEGMAKDRIIYAKDLIKNGSKEVVVLGADCVFYDTPNQFLHMGGLVVLTPHVIKPPINNGKQLYQTGHANADLILFRKNSLDILDWLVNQEMTNDVKSGVFYEQTWLSALPFLNNHIGICTDPGVNYAYFNFHERALSKKDKQYYIDDRTLKMVQFTGYVEGQPEKISRHYNQTCNDILILELFQDYERKIKWSQ